MDATYESSGSVETGGATVSALTIANVVLTGTNRNLVVWIGCRSSTTGLSVSSIARGSDTFSLQASRHNRPGFLRVWGFLYNSSNEPQTGSADLTVTMSEANSDWGFSYLNAQDVNQTIRMQTTVLNADDSTPTCAETLSVTSATGDLVLSMIVERINDLSTTMCNGETLRENWTVGANVVEGMVATAPGAASVTLSFQNVSSGQIYVHYGANLKAAPSGITLTPSSANLITSALNQDAVLGAISLAPTQSSISVGGQFGSVTLGPVSLTPPISRVNLDGNAAPPVLGSLTLTPASSWVSLSAQASAPILGSITFTPTHAPVEVLGLADAPALGPIAVTPTASLVIVTGLDPAVFSGGFLIAPASARVVVSSVDPTLGFGGLSLSPPVARYTLTAKSGSVVLGSVTLTPTQALSLVSALDPTVNTGEKLAAFLAGNISIVGKLQGHTLTEAKLQGHVETSMV